MSAPVASVAPDAKVAKVKAPPKAKPTHPKFFDMIAESLKKLGEKSGSSRQAIVKYIMANYAIDEKTCNQHTKLALKAGVKSGNLKQSKGTGASGSFKLGEAAKLKEKLAAKKAAKAAKDALKPKKVVVKKAKKVVKKVAGDKKTVAKKVVKPKTSATKKPVAKKPVAKKPAVKKVASAKPKTVKKVAAAKPKVAKPKTVKKVVAAKSKVAKPKTVKPKA